MAAQATTQLFSREDALGASRVPNSIDVVVVTAAGAAVTYTVPVNTKIIHISTNSACCFRDGAQAAVTPVAGVTDGGGSTWLAANTPERFRVQPGDTISFKSDTQNDALITIRRYAGTNATLPPD